MRTTRACAADCGRLVPAELVFCAICWLLVPEAARRRVQRANRQWSRVVRFEERTGRTSPERDAALAEFWNARASAKDAFTKREEQPT